VFALSLVVPRAQAREQEELRNRIRDGVQRTTKDLGNSVHREKLNKEQGDRFDAAMRDLDAIRDAVAGGKWEGERNRLERAADNIDFLLKNAPVEDRDLLGIDVYTLRVILDSWDAQSHNGSGKK
jgi:hypothetical protein